MADGDLMKVNGSSYSSYLEAFEAHPVTAGVFLFPLIGLMMAYHCLGLWINHTEMKIERGEFVIKKGPLYWMKSEVRIPIQNIRQAFVQEYSPFSDYDRPVLRYRLIAQMFVGGETVLESEIRLYEDAQVLERWLENNIGVKDVIVPGEVGYDAKAA